MSKPSWFSRLSGRKQEEEGSPPSPPWAEPPAEDDAEYRAHRNRGLRELARGRVEEAIKALGRAVHLRPDLVEAHLNMGRAFERAGKTEAARRAYLRALEIDLTCAEARSALVALPPPPPGREDFEVGQVLRSSTATGSYKVLEVKKGGFGAVYIARKEDSGTRYALKTFQARYLWSDEDRERFEREALTWVMLDRHPNIVTAHWVERIEGFPCLVLEYVPGGDLAHLLRKGPLPVERSLELTLQFCDGMAYAHRKLGIVHRDVKPANCLLAEDGTLKVTDFGLARAFGKAQEELLELSGVADEVKTQYTTPAGTPQYMAPEQFRPGAQLDTRTDVYAFGIMLYQMLTGDLPLIGSAAQAHIQANAGGHEVPKHLLRLILRCVEPDPRERPADFANVRAALGTVYSSVATRAAPPPAEPSPMGAAEWNNKGLALRNLGRTEEALACYERGLEIAPRRSDLWNNKGAALQRLGRLEEALACAERGLEIDPRVRDLWNNKGAALQRLGRLEEALACYDRGLEIAPRDSHLWVGKGVALHHLSRYEDALACYERGLEIDPRDSALWHGEGAALHELGRHKEALACYERALEIDPRDSDLWKNKGLALKALGRTQEAEACFRRARELGGG
jgi:serine/threonine protein kinase/predicted TPR repeat methyltransferase